MARMSEALGARTDFHLLNPAPGFSHCSVRPNAWSDIPPLGRGVDVATLQRSLERVSPSGGTPLTEAVMQIVSLVQPMAARLRAAGQSVCVIICTDGVPNDQPSFVQAMRLLQTLPVWCVVRLVTDDDGIVGYWNDLDQALEAPLEVLDDVRGEALEVHAVNPWLTYAPPLHHARLFGLPEQLFDALHEPELDVSAFVEAVRVALLQQPPVFDPRSG